MIEDIVNLDDATLMHTLILQTISAQERYRITDSLCPASVGVKKQQSLLIMIISSREFLSFIQLYLNVKMLHLRSCVKMKASKQVGNEERMLSAL